MNRPAGYAPRQSEDERSGRDHGAAVMDAEVRLLADELAKFGTLPRDDLARRVDAHLWREGTFESALRQGLEEDRFVLLPGNLVELHRTTTGGRARHG